MRKRDVIITGLLLVGGIGAIGAHGDNKTTHLNASQATKTSVTENKASEKPVPTCDGTIVTTSCTVEGINYKTYIYHPAVAEKTHIETVTTYEEKITGYCTLCNDGTYSPSCATGRGACSHHGGVAQWNAPVSTRMPVNSTKTVVDAPAQDAYYEKVAK